MIYRKIWMTEKSGNFHTVFQCTYDSFWLSTYCYCREPLTTKEQEAPLPDYTVMVQEAIYGKLSVKRLNCNIHFNKLPLFVCFSFNYKWSRVFASGHIFVHLKPVPHDRTCGAYEPEDSINSCYAKGKFIMISIR